MESDFPEDLRSDVRKSAIPIVAALRKAGCYVGMIRWDSKSARTLRFDVKITTGTVVHATCGESELTSRLKELLQSN